MFDYHRPTKFSLKGLIIKTLTSSTTFKMIFSIKSGSTTMEHCCRRTSTDDLNFKVVPSCLYETAQQSRQLTTSCSYSREAIALRLVPVKRDPTPTSARIRYALVSSENTIHCALLPILAVKELFEPVIIIERRF